METQTQTQTQQQHNSKANMKKSSSRNSDCSTHNNDSPHSPLRFHSPLRSDLGDPAETPPYASPEASPENPPDYSKAVVAVDKYTQFSPQQPTPEKANNINNNNYNINNNGNTTTQVEKSPSPVVMFNRAMREEPPPSVTKVGPGGGGGRSGGDGRRSGTVGTMLRRSPKDSMVKRAALGFRISEIVLSLISFSVMAADKTQGWSGDSFDRYKEYRVDVMVELICWQVLAYLLISASSSAATRVDDWQSNWGKDEFTEMASASVGMAFLAFVAFAFSSLISGYNLCTRDST
uniref:CASP-like protein n=1 Tax=Fagus sylvatica TaxID=28930 RepID=A0A2N9IZY7_FAGSY